MSVDDRGGRPGGFSASEASLEGFALLRRDPLTILVWAGLLLVFTAAVSVLLIAVAGPQLAEMQRLQATGVRPDAATSLRLLQRLAPVYGVLAVAAVVFYGVMWGALNRAILRPEARTPGYLALGAAEARQVGVMLLFGLTLAGAYIVLVLGAVLVAGVLGAVLHGAARLLGAVAVIGAVCALVYVATRLSLAGPMTFDTGRIVLFKAWPLSRGRVWPLLGSYVVAWLVVALVQLSFLIVFIAIAAFAGGGLIAGTRQAFHPDLTSLHAWFGPITLLYLVAASFIQALAFALVGGAVVKAYAQLRPAAPLSVAPGSAPTLSPVEPSGAGPWT